MNKDNDVMQRARLRARWMKRVQDMEPDEALVLVEALRLCAASDRGDIESALQLVKADIEACIVALNQFPSMCAALDAAVSADMKRAARTVITLQDALQRLYPQGAA
jgi:hypothetical protein